MSYAANEHQQDIHAERQEYHNRKKCSTFDRNLKFCAGVLHIEVLGFSFEAYVNCCYVIWGAFLLNVIFWFGSVAGRSGSDESLGYSTIAKHVSDYIRCKLTNLIL